MEQAYKLPCVRTVGLDAPFRWLAEGWRDMMRALVPSLFYGAVLAVVSFTLSNALINSNAAFWALALSCGFVFIAPVLAMGLYEAGRTLETGEKPTLSQMLFVRGALRQDIAYLGLALLFIFCFGAASRKSSMVFPRSVCTRPPLNSSTSHCTPVKVTRC